MTEVNKQEPLIRQARRKLAELFPDDYSVYEKWEQYKKKNLRFCLSLCTKQHGQNY